MARAYATLDLPSGASTKAALRQYRLLAKRWHPDRYAQDPQGQADAAQRMRQINAAFALIRPLLRRSSNTSSSAEPSSPASTPSGPDRPGSTASFEGNRHDQRPFGSRLRPEDIDAIVESMRGPSLLDKMPGYAARVGLYAGGLTLVVLSDGKPLFIVVGALLIVGAIAQVVAMGDRARWVRGPRQGWTAWYNR